MRTAYFYLLSNELIEEYSTGLPVAIGFSVPALSVYLATYEGSPLSSHPLLRPADLRLAQPRSDTSARSSCRRTARRRSCSKSPSSSPPERLQNVRSSLGCRQRRIAHLACLAVASGAIWTPLDVLKSRLQTGREGTSAVALTRKIIKNEGWMGLMRGYWMGTAIFVPNISVYWCIYESLKMRFIPNYSSYRPSSASSPSSAQTDSPSTFSSSSAAADAASESTGIPVTLRYTLCSVSAVAVAACTTSPIEVIQARWQTSAGSVKGGISQIVRDLWRQEGAKAFTRGVGIRVAYAVRLARSPRSVIVF